MVSSQLSTQKNLKKDLNKVNNYKVNFQCFAFVSKAQKIYIIGLRYSNHKHYTFYFSILPYSSCKR